MENVFPVMILTGAGFSVDAGLPESVQLCYKLKEYLTELCGDFGNQEATNHLALFYFLVGCIRFQRGRMGQDPDGNINIEQVATAALRLRSRGTDPLAPYVSFWNEKILQFEANNPQILERFSEMIFARLRAWLATPAPHRIEYINRLADIQNQDTSVQIFTLNYDLLIEAALTNAGKHFINGFKNGSWSASIYESSADLAVFKLHGSLDWIDDEVYGVCSLEFDRHPKAEDFEILKPPLLIFGTDAKMTGKDPFLTLVHAFSAGLLKSKVLVVIGYSFSDLHINEIVAQRLRDNLSLRVLIVAPQAESLQRAHSFLAGNPRVRTLEMKAANALNDGYVRRMVAELREQVNTEIPF
jgi:NAD-dependent SIR2 family protein deacetylase